MTPMVAVVCFRAMVMTEDTTGLLELVALAPDPEVAQWLAWSLGQAHHVAVRTLEEPPSPQRLPTPQEAR